MRRFWIFLLILLLASGYKDLYAQPETQRLADSLLRELSKRKDDTNKVKLLNDISFTYRYINTDEGIKYGQQSLELAAKLGWKPGTARALQRLATNYTVKSDYPKALEYSFKALKIWEETGDKSAIGEISSDIAYVYRDKGDYSKALEHNFKALKIAEESGNKTTIVHLLNAIGSVYKYKGDYPQALEYYFKALKIHEDFGIKRDLSITYGDICEVYYHQKKYTAAIEYGQQALKTADELGGDYTRAWALLDLGRAYLTIAEDTSAVSAAGMRQYGLTASRAAMLQSAIAYLQRGLPISKEVHSVRTMRYFYENIAQAYRLSGDYKKALAYSDTFRAIRDSVFSKENEQKILSREYESKRLEDSLRTADEKNIAGLKLEHQRSYTYLGFAVILLLLGFSFFIVREHRKSEKLLLNILPSKVAAELKSQGVSKARLFDNVTVLFTDFVNFTQAGESMSPEALIGELDICFKAFDEIIEKYNIEKIKTIGDAYLAVSGLPIPDPGHAGNIVKAAIEISKFMEDRQAMQGGKAFRVRIGIHSGSVVAGIVGVKKFAYDIWGDTVNTAARMEQSSEPGRINISQTTYELIKDKFTCVYRGEVEVKNKGKLKMYFIA